MVHPIAEADERSPFGRLTPDEFYARHGVTHSTSSFVNPRGLRIFTQRWVPRGDNAPVLGAVGVVHGFTGVALLDIGVARAPLQRATLQFLTTKAPSVPTLPPEFPNRATQSTVQPIIADSLLAIDC